MEQQKYCAFISYRHQSPDDAIAKALHTAIETYGVPASIRKKTGRKKLGRVFRDQEELPLSANLSKDIETALDHSDWFIAICSPRYLESRWCLRELEYFIQQNGRERVLTVLVEGEPEASFPEVLRVSVDEAGNRTEVEPLAANLRGNDWKKKLKDEKLRLLAPMLSVTYDELKRRERQRAIRRTVTVSAAVLVAAAGLGVFLAVNHARQERLKQEAAQQAAIAEEQRARAEEEQRQKEEQAAIAEAERQRAEEEQRKAEEERLRAEEEQRQKELERKNAVYNDLGERLERASAALKSGEKRTAASVLLDALTISGENEDMRRDELMAQLKKALYIEPFAIVSSFDNQNKRVNDITVSPAGDRAIGIVNGNAIAMIDLNANEVLYQVSVGNAMITDPCFSADGSRFLALCDMGRLVTVWNTLDGTVAFSYTADADEQYRIANAFFWKDEKELFIQDMEHFYLVCEDGSRTLFYTMGEQMPEYDESNNLISRITGASLGELFTFHNDDYTGTPVLATADRSRILIGGARGDTAVIVLDDGGNRVSIFGVPADATVFMPGLMSETWSLSPDGRTAVCLSLLGIIGGWDTDTGELIILDGFDYSGGFDRSDIAFSADSRRMAYVAEGQLYVADARTGALELQATIDETSFVPSLAFTEDGNYLLMINQSLFIINAHTWAVELIENAEFGSQYNNVVPLTDAFLITKYDGTANFYSMPELASVKTLDGFDGKLCEASPAYFPSVPLTGEHRYTDAFLQSTGKTMDTTPQLSFARDGKTAALSYADGTIELFDTEGDGSVAAMIGELTSPIAAIAMTERQLVAADDSTRLLIYDLEEKAVQRILNVGTVYSRFAFDPEGKLLMALCGGLTKIDVYSLETFEKLFSLHATADTFRDMAFSEDGAFAVGVTAAEKYVVGDLWADEDALLTQARKLTGAEP